MISRRLELAALTPGPYIHIGGDEALATSASDYVYFIERVQRIVQSHGKQMIGWEEIGQANLLMPSIAQHWHSATRAQRAADKGAGIIMSPATKAYLDMKYDASTRGNSWAGYTDVLDAYIWEPTTQVAGVSSKSILGVEAPLWTELVKTMADIEFMTFPRLIGHAEIG